MKTDTMHAAYLAQYNRAMAQIQAIKDRIHDLPAPDTDYLDWGHVGDMAKIADDLKEIATPEK